MSLPSGIVPDHLVTITQSCSRLCYLTRIEPRFHFSSLLENHIAKSSSDGDREWSTLGSRYSLLIFINSIWYCITASVIRSSEHAVIRIVSIHTDNTSIWITWDIGLTSIFTCNYYLLILWFRPGSSCCNCGWTHSIAWTFWHPRCENFSTNWTLPSLLNRKLILHIRITIFRISQPCTDNFQTISFCTVRIKDQTLMHQLWENSSENSL